MEKYAFALLFERFDASHVHRIFVVAIIEWVSIVSIDGRDDRTGWFGLGVISALLRRSIGRCTVHFNYKIYQGIILYFALLIRSK